MSTRWVLVDGYSVMHGWSRLTSKRMALASRREEIVRLLCQYADHTGRKVTVVFDGHQLRHKPEIPDPLHGMEVLFSRHGKTADELIERLVGQAGGRQHILVVSSDHMVRQTVESLGAESQSSEAFEADLNSVLAELSASIRRHHTKR